MDIELFNYEFPEELIAQQPLPDRSASRLMVLDPFQKSWQHKRFIDFTSFFGPEDLLVFNEVRVMPSRLYGQTKTGRQVEVLLLDQRRDAEWTCLVRPANKLKDGVEVTFSGKLKGRLSGRGDEWTIIFSPISRDLLDLITAAGLPPLPPYIKRDAPFESKHEDVQRYQTVYAKTGTAAAAPTAGFHFTNEILADLNARGCETAGVILHVSRDTFQPVRANDVTAHKMHGESYEIPAASLEKIQRAKKEGRRVTAIGTTTVRTLESVWDPGGETGQSPLQAGPGYTRKFIYPGYRFQVVDRILTNFHQPKSTLLMLVSAFAGREFILDAYREAVAQHYRLFSFGDAMLILNSPSST